MARHNGTTVKTNRRPQQSKVSREVLRIEAILAAAARREYTIE